MNFGTFIPQGWRLDLAPIKGNGSDHYQVLKTCASKAESLGYRSLWLYDHLHTIPEALPESCFEVFTTTAAIAEATSTIRLGQMCTCNIYRPPTLLAKIAANLDCISNGRLEMGIGAGWYQHECVSYGYPFEKPAQRIGQLEEAVQILKGMWTQEQFQFEGKYYTVGKGTVRNYRGQEVELAGAFNHPKPIQSPHPPLWIAGGGEQLTLKTVARHAQYSNFMGSLEQVLHKNEVLDQHCMTIGSNPFSLLRSININVFLGSDQEFSALMRDCKRTPQDTEDLRKMLYPREKQALVDRLGALQDKAKVDTVIVYFPDAAAGDSMEKFAAEVIPSLR